MPQRLYLRFALAGLSGLATLCASGRPVQAWTPVTQVEIAREAARLAPPDLARQIAKHQEEFEAGATDPFQESDPNRHSKNPDGSGTLDRAYLDEVDGAISAIRNHHPFEEVVRRLGKVSHWTADANDPLATSGTDPDEGRYFVDYLRYAETAEPRFPLVFYGVPPDLDRLHSLRPLIDQALRRGRDLYPLVGREYRRIGYGSGIGVFDDRSTAFGVASLSFSHAVTDVALTLRYIWLAAGGADDRTSLVHGGTRLLVLPRADRAR
jgi:hypothetical protein